MVASVIVVCVAVSGCFFDYSYQIHLVGPYYAVAIENKDMLGIDRQSEHADGVFAGRIPAVVIDIGYNSQYIVASRRPPEDPGGELSYFYIDLAEDGPGGAPDGAVIGPLTKEEFEAAKVSLNLPGFSLHYPELR